MIINMDYLLEFILLTLQEDLRVSKAIRAGIVFINTYRLISPMAPFGGLKDSGYGKEAGIESIKEYTRIKQHGIIHLINQ